MIIKSNQHIRPTKNIFLLASESDGFTVAELVLALAMMMTVMAAMVSLLISLNGIYTVQNVAAGVQQETRAGINIMTRDIRMAGLNPLKINQIGILEASVDKIRFQHDANGNGIIESDQDEDIAYLLNRNHQLIRQKDGNSRSNRSIVDKVHALLRGRMEMPPGMSEILLGDDTEADPAVYALYHRFTSRQNARRLSELASVEA